MSGHSIRYKFNEQNNEHNQSHKKKKKITTRTVHSTNAVDLRKNTSHGVTIMHNLNRTKVANFYFPG